MDRVEYQSLIIQDLVNLHSADELNLSPWYQRRSVWNVAQKSYLINTLLEQKPIPAIYIRHSIDLERSRSIKEVVDGQQRIRAILEYNQDKFPAKHPNGLIKKRYSQLNRTERQDFLLTSIPVGYLLGADDSDVIDIFGRINSVSKVLNGQERRNAAFSGEMKQLCLVQGSSRISFWRDYGIFSGNEIGRMKEIQFISELVFNFVNGLSDASAQKLTGFYQLYDEEFDQADEINSRLDRLFDLLSSLNPSILKHTIFKRQPIFFSLCIVVDSDWERAPRGLENIMLEIDERFNSEENRSADDDAFRIACTATTQRIAQRTIRDKYIRSFI